LDGWRTVLVRPDLLGWCQFAHVTELTLSPAGLPADDAAGHLPEKHPRVTRRGLDTADCCRFIYPT
jgi:hypothetical protein